MFCNNRFQYKFFIEIQMKFMFCYEILKNSVGIFLNIHEKRRKGNSISK